MCGDTLPHLLILRPDLWVSKSRCLGGADLWIQLSFFVCPHRGRIVPSANIEACLSLSAAGRDMCVSRICWSFRGLFIKTSLTAPIHFPPFPPRPGHPLKPLPPGPTQEKYFLRRLLDVVGAPCFASPGPRHSRIPRELCADTRGRRPFAAVQGGAVLVRGGQLAHTKHDA